MSRQFLIELLKGVEAEVPPPTYCHHALTFTQYGSDEQGWEDKLALQVNQDGTFRCLFLDEADFDKHPSDLVKEIVAMLALPILPNTQIGIGMGQYVEDPDKPPLTYGRLMHSATRTDRERPTGRNGKDGKSPQNDK